MTREELRGLGIEDDAIIDKVLDKTHEEQASLKAQLQTAQQERDAAQTKATQYQEEIKKFDGVDIEELRAKPEQIESQYKETIKQLKLDNAIEKHLAGVKHANLLKPQIDTSKLELDDQGNVTGLDEQVNGLKETYPDFFKPSVDGIKPAKTTTEEPLTLTKEDIMKEPNTSKRQQLIEANLHLFNQE